MPIGQRLSEGGTRAESAECGVTADSMRREATHSGKQFAASRAELAAMQRNANVRECAARFHCLKRRSVAAGLRN